MSTWPRRRRGSRAAVGEWRGIVVPRCGASLLLRGVPAPCAAQVRCARRWLRVQRQPAGRRMRCQVSTLSSVGAREHAANLQRSLHTRRAQHRRTLHTAATRSMCSLVSCPCLTPRVPQPAMSVTPTSPACRRPSLVPACPRAEHMRVGAESGPIHTATPATHTLVPR